MGKTLAALREIAGRQPPPHRPKPLEPDLKPREIERSEMAVPPEEFVPVPEPPGRSGDDAAHARYAALAEAILSQLPTNRKGALLLAGLDDRDVRGELRPLFLLLAERVPGRTILVDCNDGCRAFARVDDAHAGPVPHRSAAAFWARAVVRSNHPRLDLLSGVETSTKDATTPSIEPEALLGELRRAYELVVLVGAPTSDLEIALLGGACDGTYLVVRLGRTSRHRAGRAIRTLTQAGVRVLGSVLLER